MKPTPTPEMIEALEVARDQIITMYRTWVVDDATAMPTEISLAGRAIAKIDAALSVPAAAAVGKPEPIGYCSEYGLGKLASQAHHYCLSVSKAQENEFQFPIYAAPSAPEGWQPIETAPAKGRFLVMAAGSIERLDSVDPAYVHTIEANDGPITCEAFESGKGFIDEFGEQYETDGRVSDAEDLTAEDDVLRLTHWCPLPTPPALRSEKP